MVKDNVDFHIFDDFTALSIHMMMYILTEKLKYSTNKLRNKIIETNKAVFVKHIYHYNFCKH